MAPKITDEQLATLETFISTNLPSIISEVKYDELYGHQLNPKGTYYSLPVTKLLLVKFLHANDFNLDLAAEQLRKALEWRKEFKPLSAAFLEKHDEDLVELGYVTKIGDEVFTWNIYGSMQKSGLLKDDNFDKFVRYRIGLMERGLQLLSFAGGDDGEAFLGQIHDYDGVSLLKYDADTKRASKTIIQLFQDYYPELLSKKYFVNVPKVMAWIYDLVKGWLPDETTKKFKMLNKGSKLGKLIGSEDDIPTEYGGKNSKTLKEQNITDVKMTEYTGFLLEEQFTNELD
jgi:hypothetical protein